MTKMAPLATTAGLVTPSTQRHLHILEPFRFLDLPPELRCMVYEELEIATRRHVLSDVDVREASSWEPPQAVDLAMTLVRKSIPVAILRTCRIINEEATPLLARKLRHLEKMPLCFQLSYGAAALITGEYPFLECLVPAPTSNTVLSDVDDTLNARVADFVSRCSTFLEHTHQVSRDNVHKDHVELIVSEYDDQTEPHGNEVVICMKSAMEIAAETSISFMFAYRKSFPEIILSPQNGEEDIAFTRRDVGRLLDLITRGCRSRHGVNLSFRVNVVKTDEAWAKLLED